MLVSIIGSWRDVDAATHHLVGGEQFADACRQLGAGIVMSGHTLLAASAEPHTADFHAVKGALDVLQVQAGGKPQIILFGQRDPFSEWTQNHGHLVTTRYAQVSEPALAKLFQVKEVDCVIVIGGAESTLQAGLAAAVSRKLVLPVGSFGGSGKQLHHLLSVTHHLWPQLPPQDVFGQLGGGWSAHTRKIVLDQLGQGLRLLIIHGRSADRFKLKDYLQNTLKLPTPTLMIDRFAPGKTLPEKWELVADGIDGAIALVTPDDVGALAGMTEPVSALEKRARQNVWLEVGWFWGRAGRQRVLLLVRGDAVIPSDLRGIETVSYDEHPKEAGDSIRQFVDSLRQTS